MGIFGIVLNGQFMCRQRPEYVARTFEYLRETKMLRFFHWPNYLTFYSSAQREDTAPSIFLARARGNAP